VAGAACEDGEEGAEGVGEEDGGEAEGCVGGDEEGGEGGCGSGWVKVVGHGGYFFGMLGGFFFVLAVVLALLGCRCGRYPDYMTFSLLFFLAIPLKPSVVNTKLSTVVLCIAYFPQPGLPGFLHPSI